MINNEIRLEQINREAEVYALTGSMYDIKTAFINGAKYADEHPREDLVSIDDVCSWLRNDLFEEDHNGTFNSLSSCTLEGFITQLRKDIKKK